MLSDFEIRFSAIERRILQLEMDKRELVTEARSAAATAASAAASVHLADLARQVGVMQEQMRRFGDPAAAPRRRPKRLPPPRDDGG